MPLPPVNTTEGPLALQTPTPLQIARACRNGLIPSASFETDLVGSINHAAAVRTKQLFSWGCPLTNIPSEDGSTTRTRWRAAGHTGPVLSKIKATVLMARGGSFDLKDACTATIYVTNADESTTYGSGSFTFGNTTDAAHADVPSEMGYGGITISGVPANTPIYIRVDESKTSRIVACSIYEQSLPVTSANGYIVPASVSVQGPIYGNRRKRALELATSLWKHGAAPLCNWTVDNQSSPRTVSDSTPLNVIDGAASGSSGPRYRIDTRYCRTRSKATVPCVLAAYASMSGSSDTGEIWLTGASAGFVGSVSVSGTAAKWHTATIDLPADLDDYYIEISNPDGNETLSVGAVSLYQYAA